MPTLAQKKAFVTGGSRGIGAGIVQKLAEEGADVGFTSKSHEDAASNVSKEVEAIGRRVIAIKADSAKADRLAKAADEAAGFLGGLDIFVSSAGALLFKPISEFTLEDFDEIVSLDLRAAFVGSKAVLPHMNLHQLMSLSGTGSHLPSPKRMRPRNRN